MRFEDIILVLQQYGAILFGLLVGTVAHFGRFLMAGDMPSIREIAGFVMHLGIIGLVASVSTRMLGIVDDDMRALATAILAISAQEVVQYLRRNGWGRLAGAAVPGTIEGERRQAEQVARSATYIEDKGLLDEAIARTAPEKEGKPDE